MEGRETGVRRGIPRLSRLPVPRHAISQASDIEQDISHKASNIQRPSASSALPVKSRASLSNNDDRSSQARYGQTTKRAGHQSSNQNNQQPEAVSLLNSATIFNTDAPDEHQDGNQTADEFAAEKRKRKPRPSLSERTLETLSQIPPSPSPSRQRLSIANQSMQMRPPNNRPASALGSSQPTSVHRQRSVSPFKQTGTLDRYSTSPIKHTLSSVGVSDGESAYTPSRVPANRSKIAISIPRLTDIHSNPLKHQDETGRKSTTPARQTYKATSMYNLRGAALNNSTTRSSNISDFRDVSSLSMYKDKIPHAHQLEKKKEDPGTKPKLTTRMQKLSVATKNQGNVKSGEALTLSEISATGSKSSLALRETIARAKAAKRDAIKKATPTIPNESVARGEDLFAVDIPVYGQQTLQKRLHGAVTSGTLNIAAMNLSALPAGIRTMYDFDSDSKINWSEAVDLIKFNAADNAIEELPELFFPDWSLQELQDDEEKHNLFGGLQTLDLRRNRLINLPTGLRRLEQLQTLILNNNKFDLGALDVICQMRSLKELYLANNNLRGAVPACIGELVELQILDLHSNFLTILPDSFSALHNLRKIDISDNNLRDISFVHLQGLPIRELNLSKNELSGCLIPHNYTNTKLVVLNAASNKLHQLAEQSSDFDFPELQTLICDSNHIRVLPTFKLLRSLASVSAAHNQIESWPEGFATCKCLRNVDLSGNQIKIVDPEIANLANLTTLNIAANPLRDRKYLAMSTELLKKELRKRLSVNEELLDDLVITSEDNFVGDNVGYTDKHRKKYVPENGTLDLSSEGLVSVGIPLITLDQPVHSIRLANNNLTNFPVELLSHSTVNENLRILDLSNNDFTNSIDYLTSDLSLPSLQSLSLMSTGITSLSALMSHLSAPSLKELNISCNRLTGPLPVLRPTFPSLRNILAIDNGFTSIDIDSIESLEIVDISNNSIDHLPPKIGELGNFEGTKAAPGRLRTFQCTGNTFRVPRATTLEKGTEAILRDLRRMVPSEQIGDAWR